MDWVVDFNGGLRLQKSVEEEDDEALRNKKPQNNNGLCMNNIVRKRKKSDQNSVCLGSGFKFVQQSTPPQ